MRKGRQYVYQMLVNRIQGIRYRYHQMREGKHGIGRIGSWCYLLLLNAGWYLLRIKKIRDIPAFAVYEEKKVRIPCPESEQSARPSPLGLAKELEPYDVISFDVFDTLIFRSVSEPTDVFYVAGEKLNYMDFKRIRQEMEQRCRQKHWEEAGSYEVTLEDIYDVLSKETGIDKWEGLEAELEAETEHCYANPYMLTLLSLLREQGKRLVVTSDMYLSEAFIRMLLKDCGLGEFEAYFISCEQGVSKSNGELYEILNERVSSDRIAHIGDNRLSDIWQAQKHGIQAYHYRNVNDAGRPYRPFDMSPIAGSLYRGLINAHIYNGSCSYSGAYEYGYIYGGWFAVGYCQFIHRYVQQQAHTHPVERILFFTRDGDILKQVYERIYPEETSILRYACWSRLAAMKLTADRYRYDFLRRMLYHKVNQGYSVKEVFDTVDLSDMCPKDYEREMLTDGNVEVIKEDLLKHWNQVISHYESESQAAALYYRDILGNSRHAAAVDIGWAGSGALLLDFVVNQTWKMNCEITGLIAGTNTCHNAEPDMSVTQLQSGKLVSYLYAPDFNRDLWKYHDPNKGDNLYWEALLSSPKPSVRGFMCSGQGDVQIRYRQKDSASMTEAADSAEIQRGILDFTEDFLLHGKRNGAYPVISGRDAYAPMLAAGSHDRRYLRDMISVRAEDGNVT